MKRKFIFNPGSFIGKKNKLKDIEKYFLEKTGEFSYHITQSREDAIITTRQTLKDGYEQVVALGGDGTLNAIVNGFYENGKNISNNALLTVAPLGTGSDFFKTIKENGKFDSWQELVLNSKTINVDIGEIILDGDPSKRRYFINIASVGMSGKISDDKNKNISKCVPRSLAYLMPTIKNMAHYKPNEVDILVDNEQIHTKLTSMFIAKGKYSGGGMRFGGGVKLDDGFFDVKIFHNMKPYEMIFRVAKLYTGKYDEGVKLKRKMAKSVKVVAKEPVYLEFEGEVDIAKHIDISLRAKDIRLCV